jgi:putative FmdB family regulatory protein
VPTYDYRCEKCGTFEQWQSIKDDALTACPKCGAKVERLISANVGFVLKGSGFYQNEYKNTVPASAKSIPAAPVAPTVPAVTPAAPPAASGCGGCSEKSSCPSASN